MRVEVRYKIFLQVQRAVPGSNPAIQSPVSNPAVQSRAFAPARRGRIAVRRSRLFPNGFKFDNASMRTLGDKIGQFLSGLLGANKGGGGLNLAQFRNLGRGRERVRGRGRFEAGPSAGNRQGDSVRGEDPRDPHVDAIPPVSGNLDPELESLDYFEDSRFMPVRGRGPTNPGQPPRGTGRGGSPRRPPQGGRRPGNPARPGNPSPRSNLRPQPRTRPAIYKPLRLSRVLVARQNS